MDTELSRNVERLSLKESSDATGEDKACAALLFAHINKQQEAIWLNDVLEIDGLPEEKRISLSCDTFSEVEPLQEYDDDMKGKFVNIITNVWELVARGIGLSPNEIAGIKQEAVSHPPLTVSQLRESQISQLANLLDDSRGYVDLGRSLFCKDKQFQLDVKNLQLHEAGGGSPAEMLFQLLQQKGIYPTVKELQEKCVEAERVDVKKLLDGIDPQQLIIDIDFSTLQKVKKTLDVGYRGQCSACDIGGLFGFSQDECNLMRNAIHKRYSYSPTRKLLQLIRAKDPDLKVSELISSLRQLNRNDAAKFLAETV